MYRDMNGAEIKVGSRVRIHENEEFHKQCCPLDFIDCEFSVENLMYDKYAVICDWFFPVTCLEVID